MSQLIAVSSIAPLLADPTVRAEQVSQLLLGETGTVTERSAEWIRIRTADDGYEGWVHGGYVRETDDADADGWRSRATAWSEGARITVDGSPVPVPVPLRARLEAGGGGVTLPDGRTGRVTEGRLRPLAEVEADSLRQPAECWALDRFGGTSYLWGGVTPWGVDCSGLVQTTFRARGLSLPRDSADQADTGDAVPLDAPEPGDLLFFRSETGAPRITHVAFAAADGHIIHSTIACGGVTHESFAAGSRAGTALRPRLVAVRRVARR